MLSSSRLFCEDQCFPTSSAASYHDKKLLLVSWKIKCKESSHLFISLSSATFFTWDVIRRLALHFDFDIEASWGNRQDEAGNISGHYTLWTWGSRLTEVRRKPSRHGCVEGLGVKGQSALKIKFHDGGGVIRGYKNVLRIRWLVLCLSPLSGINWKYLSLCSFLMLCTVIISFKFFF